jgi:hypothetical protein
MCDEMFRARNCDRAFSCNKFSKLKGLLHDLIPTALNNFGYKSEFLSLDSRERSRSIGKLPHQRVVPSDLGQESQRADVRCKANVNLLFVSSIQIHLELESNMHSTRTLIAKLVFAAA